MKYTKYCLAALFLGAFLLIFAGPASAKLGNFWVAMDQEGNLVPEQSYCDGYPDNPLTPGYEGLWYYYPDAPSGPWWNQWWYNDPYDPCRRKVVWVSFWYGPYIPGLPGFLEVTINWSLPEWSPNPDQPPLPEDEEYVGRLVPAWERPVPPEGYEYFESSVEPVYLPIDYNPEWVSIDVRGFNFVIQGENPALGGEIYHECVECPDAEDPVALIAGDYQTILGLNVIFGGEVTLDGSGSTDDCGIKLYDWGIDGEIASGVNPTFSGLAKGTYTVTLTVTDCADKTDTDTIELRSCFISTATND
ncbi:MAG: PKD domain-containing protein [Thermodesulfobacteriota bacterium]|nr:PKD domain-containing protein [Thermodesulfobacteriota bacterium]